MGDRLCAVESLAQVKLRWQRMLEGVARQLSLPIAMINVLHGSDLVVLGLTDEHRLFRQGQRIALAVNSYCASVLTKGEDLFVSDVRRLPCAADGNPVAGLGLIHYYGEPIRDPKGGVVGTVCVMDDRPRSDAPGIRSLVSLMREAIEHDLSMLLHARRLERLNQELMRSAQSLFEAIGRAGLATPEQLTAHGFSDMDVQSLKAFAGTVATSR